MSYRNGNEGRRVIGQSQACRHGHPYPENLCWNNRGWRYCGECSRIRVRRWNESNRPQPDEVAIIRAIAGDPPERLTARERATAVAQLNARQLTTAVIAERVGCTPRTVHRIRARLRHAAPAAA